MIGTDAFDHPLQDGPHLWHGVVPARLKEYGEEDLDVEARVADGCRLVDLIGHVEPVAVGEHPPGEAVGHNHIDVGEAVHPGAQRAQLVEVGGGRAGCAEGEEHGNFQLGHSYPQRVEVRSGPLGGEVVEGPVEGHELQARQAVVANRPFQLADGVVRPAGEPPFGHVS